LVLSIMVPLVILGINVSIPIHGVVYGPLGVDTEYWYGAQRGFLQVGNECRGTDHANITGSACVYLAFGQEKNKERMVRFNVGM